MFEIHVDKSSLELNSEQFVKWIKYLQSCKNSLNVITSAPKLRNLNLYLAI